MEPADRDDHLHPGTPPRRRRVLAAKILTRQAVSLAGAGFAFLAARAVVLAAHVAGRGITTGWEWQKLAGFIAFILLTAAIGIAFGALLHNTAVAIVSYFALGGVFSLLIIPALQAAGRWVNTGQTYGWVLEGQWAGHGSQIAVSSLLWIALPLALA